MTKVIKTETTPKAQTSAVASAIDLSNPLNGVLTLTFLNGNQLVLKADMLTPEIATQAMFHGLKQKLVDAAAMSRNTDTGASASIDDKEAAVREVFERLTVEQSWNSIREGGSATGGLLYRALLQMFEGKRTPEQVKATIEGWTENERAAMRKNAKVATIIATLQAAKPDVAKVDTGALLAQLDA